MKRVQTIPRLPLVAFTCPAGRRKLLSETERASGPIYKLRYAAPRLSWRVATKTEGWSAFRLFALGSKHFNLTAVSTGGAGGWFSLGGASSSLGSSHKEKPALELELLAQSGAEHEQSPSKDKL